MTALNTLSWASLESASRHSTSSMVRGQENPQCPKEHNQMFSRFTSGLRHLRANLGFGFGFVAFSLPQLPDLQIRLRIRNARPMTTAHNVIYF